MPLDLQSRKLLDQLNSLPPFESFSPVELRELMTQPKAELTDFIHVGSFESANINGPHGEIPIRIYKPNGNGPFPVLIYFHGGGWVIGGIEGPVDTVCRKITNYSQCAVVSVGYHLAPEFKFPAAVEDAFIATKWIYENAEELGFDASRIAVGGDSAGGTLAAVVTHIAKEKGIPNIALQILIYPATDCLRTTESFKAFGEGYFLTRNWVDWFYSHYSNTMDEKKSPLISPILYEDFTGLPPALIITAEYDPLRDEGEMYADRLREERVPVVYSCYQGTIHGFVTFENVLDTGKQAIKEIADTLRRAFLKGC